MDQELRTEITQWLNSWGVDGMPLDDISTTILVIASLILSMISYLFVRRGVVRAMNIVIHRSRAVWDDIFMQCPRWS